MRTVKNVKKAKETAINVMAITDDGAKNIWLPLELIQETIENITKDGEAPLIFGDGSYLTVKGLVIGRSDFYKERRVILLGSELH